VFHSRETVVRYNLRTVQAAVLEIAWQRELERVLASPQFAESPRLQRLLRYIVEKSAAGDRESLKEYSIGLDVFDRDASFDPKVDSIVRATVRQLRLKLADYYQTHGQHPDVVIRVPKGSYLAEFETVATPEPAASENPAPEHRPWWKLPAAVVSVALVLTVGIWSVTVRNIWPRGAHAAKHPPRNPRAVDLYSRAFALARTREPAQMRKAANLFEQLVTAEPDFAPGWAAAASNYLAAVNNGAMTWQEAGPRGVECARRAVAVDGSLAEAHAALAAAFEDEWKWPEAEVELRRATELDPKSARSYYQRAMDLMVLKRFSEAEGAISMARVLDPSWAAPNGLLGELYYYDHRWDDALALAERMRPVFPGEAIWDNVSWRVYVATGRPQQARPFLSRQPELLSRAWLKAVDGDAPGAWSDLLRAHRSSGVSSFLLASFATSWLHDRGAALDWLERSLRDHEPDLASLAIEPIFDEIRPDPRAQAILRAIHLAE
jgi:tetratricopeptide (TPR) repeat protein